MEHLILWDTSLKPSVLKCTQTWRKSVLEIFLVKYHWRLCHLKATQLVMRQNCKEVSLGKTPMTGHWESSQHYRTVWYLLEWFPEEIITKIEEFSGRKVIREANKPYSGTAVIDDFGPRQNGNRRVDHLYLSWPSPSNRSSRRHHSFGWTLPYLWICTFHYFRASSSSRTIIARPYVGEPGNFTRTTNRPTWLFFHHLRQLFWIRTAAHEKRRLHKLLNKVIVCMQSG